MPYLPISQRESDDQQAAGAAPTGETVLSGSGGVISAGGPGGGGLSQAGQASNGAGGQSPNANLSDYLNANAGQNAAKLGSDVAGTVTGSVNQARGDLAGAQQTFQQQADQNTTQVDPSILANVQNDPTKVTGDQGTLGAFQKMQSANYAGPKSLSDIGGQYGQATNDYSNAQTEVNAAGNSAGQQTLLQQTYNRPQGYSQGEQTLDSFLLGGSQEGQQALQGVQQQYQGLGNELSNASSQSQQYAQQAAATDQATQQAANQALTAGYTGLQGNLTTGAANLNAQRTAQYNQVAGDAKSGNLSAADQQTLGISGWNPQDASYVNLMNYLSQGDQAGLNNVATTQDQANYAAYNQLDNNALNFLTPSAAVNPAVNFNGTAFKSDVGQQFSGLNSNLTAAAAAQTAQRNAAYQQAVQALQASTNQGGTVGSIYKSPANLPTNADFKAMGINGTDYLSQGAADTSQNVATTAQQQQYNNLAALLGNGQTLGAPSAAANNINFDYSRLGADATKNFNTIQTASDQANAARQAQYNQLSQQAAAGDPAALATLGLSGQNLYGVNPGQYLSYAGPVSGVSAGQASQEAALASYLNMKDWLPSTASTTPLYNLNQTSLNQAIQQAQQAAMAAKEQPAKNTGVNQ